MESILLWASVVVGVLVSFSAFLTRKESAAPLSGAGIADASPQEGDALSPLLRSVALALPVVGLLVALPTGKPFSAGQGLGLGFLIGGAAALLAFLPLLMKNARLGLSGLLAGPYGMAVAAAALPVLLLRASLLDALMGVAIGWFSVAFTLYFGTATGRRTSDAGAVIATATGFTITLCAGTLIGALRDPSANAFSKIGWDASLLSAAAFGSVLLYAASFLPSQLRFGLSWLRWGMVAVPVALALYLLSEKIVGEPRLWYIGLGGLLLCPMAILVLRDAARRAKLLPPVLSWGGLPLLAVLLVTSGFLVAFQALQAFGASVVVTMLFLALPAALPLPTGDVSEADDTRPLFSGTVSLLLFSVGLLLYRLFVARWTGELKGVTLTDQYALFGLIIGAALPALLAAVPLRRLANGGTPAVLTLIICGALTLLAPGAILLLFGGKCALALLLGLALGTAQVFVAGYPHPTKLGTRLGGSETGPLPTFFPALLALAVALALCQWSGLLLPAVADLTRALKVRWLVGLLAGLVVLLFVSDRMNASSARATGEK